MPRDCVVEFNGWRLSPNLTVLQFFTAEAQEAQRREDALPFTTHHLPLTNYEVGGSGICGVAASSTAGNAVATPAAIALIDPSLSPVVNTATSQIAAAVVTTIIFTPILTQLFLDTWVRNNGLVRKL